MSYLKSNTNSSKTIKKLSLKNVPPIHRIGEQILNLATIQPRVVTSGIAMAASSIYNTANKLSAKPRMIEPVMTARAKRKAYTRQAEYNSVLSKPQAVLKDMVAKAKDDIYRRHLYDVKVRETGNPYKAAIKTAKEMNRREPSYTYGVPAYGTTVSNNPIKHMIDDIATTQLGVKNSDKTERDFSPQQLDVLDDLVRAIPLSKYELEQIARGDTIRKPITGDVYSEVKQAKGQGSGYGNSTDGLWNMISKPHQQVERIIGQGNVDFYKEGYTVNDVYDFSNTLNKDWKNGRYGLLRNTAYRLGHRDDNPSHKNKTRKFIIKRKVNHW